MNIIQRFYNLFANYRNKYYLSILAPVRFEEDYIEEFVCYYLIQGVDHFYFYDNGCSPSLKEILKNYLSHCTIIELTGESIQIPAYSHFVENFKHETKWIAVFDIDEFVLPLKHKNFKEFLMDKENEASIAINWRFFGSSKHLTKQKGLLTKNYQYSTGGQNSYFKCVTQTKYLKSLPHPHRPTLHAKKYVTNAKGTKVEKYETYEDTSEIIRLNHYYTKSKQEFDEKLNRKRADTGVKRVDIKEDASWIYDVPESASYILDQALWLKYGDEIEARMKST